MVTKKNVLVKGTLNILAKSPATLHPSIRNGSDSSILVHGDVVDHNMGIVVVGTIGNSVTAGSCRDEDVTGPITAYADVEDKLEVTEGAIDVTRVASPQSNWSSPTFGVRVTVLDILGDTRPLEPPGCNGVIVPKHGVDTAACHVEVMTNTSRDISEGAASVVDSRALTFGRDGGSEETLARRTVCTLELGANIGVRFTDSVGASMQSVLVGGVIIDEFDDIDLSGIWP